MISAEFPLDKVFELSFKDHQAEQDEQRQKRKGTPGKGKNVRK
jgi:hypothetical protein